MQSGATVRIKLASSSDSEASNELIVNRKTIASWSSCANGLPDDATEWDLSQLPIEGKAVERSTVVAWLNAVDQLKCRPRFPSRFWQIGDPTCTVSSLTQLLAFADAVGSSKALLHACLPPLRALVCDVRFPNSGIPAMLATDMAYNWRHTGSAIFLEGNTGNVQGTVDNMKQMSKVSLQTAADVESLLYLAHKLQLYTLIDRLKGS